MDRVELLFANEFDLLIAKQKSEGLEINDLRRLDILTRSFKAYTSNPIKKDVEDDLSLYSDEVLKKILNGTKTESQSSRLDEADSSREASTDEGT